MTEVELSLPETKNLSQKEFLDFYSEIYSAHGYLGTLLFQKAHLHSLLLHLIPTDLDPTTVSLGEMLPIAQLHNILNPKQMKHCRTLLELSVFYSSKSLLGLSKDTGKGVYYFGQINDILYDLTQKLGDVQ